MSFATIVSGISRPENSDVSTSPRIFIRLPSTINKSSDVTGSSSSEVTMKYDKSAVLSSSSIAARSATAVAPLSPAPIALDACAGESVKTGLSSTGTTSTSIVIDDEAPVLSFTVSCRSTL